MIRPPTAARIAAPANAAENPLVSRVGSAISVAPWEAAIAVMAANPSADPI